MQEEGLDNNETVGVHEAHQSAQIQNAFEIMAGFRQQSMDFTRDLMSLAAESSGLVDAHTDLLMLLKIVEAEGPSIPPHVRVIVDGLKQKHVKQEPTDAES